MENEKVLQGYNLLLEYQAAEKAHSEGLLELASDLQNFIECSPYKPNNDFSLLELIGGIREPKTSKIIAEILDYKNERKQYVLLESFIRNFINPDLTVERPKITAEKEHHLDIAIKDRHYAIVIENKLFNAPFQRNQLARYIGVLKEKFDYDESEIYVVIMPQFLNTPIRQSAGNLPEDWNAPNDERKCRVGEYECWCDYPDRTFPEYDRIWCSEHCKRDILKNLRHHTYKLHDNFADWLIEESEKLPNTEWPIKSGMLQFAFFIKGLYNTRFSDKLNMAITDFLRKKLIKDGNPNENFEKINETILEIDQLRDAVSRLKGQVAIDLVKKWEFDLKNEFPNLVSNLDENGEYSFGLRFDGVWIGCWSGTENDGHEPYWGFYCNLEAQTKKDMVNKILLECCFDEEANFENDFLVKAKTTEGDIICRKLYRAALALGYK